MFRCPIITVLAVTAAVGWMSANSLLAQPLQPMPAASAAPTVVADNTSPAPKESSISQPESHATGTTATPAAISEAAVPEIGLLVERNPAGISQENNEFRPSFPSYFTSLPPLPDDGPFHWPWHAESDSQSIYEYRSRKSTPRPNWLDRWLGKSKPSSPQLTLSDLTRRPGIGSQPGRTPKESIWESTKQRMGKWQQSLKDSSQRHWQSLKAGFTPDH